MNRYRVINEIEIREGKYYNIIDNNDKIYRCILFINSDEGYIDIPKDINRYDLAKTLIEYDNTLEKYVNNYMEENYNQEVFKKIYTEEDKRVREEKYKILRKRLIKK